MFVSHSKNGKEIKSEFLDWCLMETLIADIQDEQNISKEEAYKIFWEEVRDYNSEEYDLILESYNGDFYKALGDGAFDEIRADYVIGLGYEYAEVKEMKPEEEKKYMLITERDEGIDSAELKRSINRDESTYWFSLSYDNAKQIPEIISLYTDEGKIYKDNFAIYLNYKTGKIEHCEQISSDADYIDVPNPVLSLPLLKALTDKARKMVEYLDSNARYNEYAQEVISEVLENEYD